MHPSPAPDRQDLRRAVMDGLARLRSGFPLETRIRQAAPILQQAYSRILDQWLQRQVPVLSDYDPAVIDALQALDAIVPGPQGIGCYPFSASSTGITVHWPTGRVSAMCAIDALAMARLAGHVVVVESTCLTCQTPLTVRVEANGGLDHDQAGLAQVVWLESPANTGSCSTTLCRQIRLLCNDCTPPADSLSFTLPQAAAIGNAFFAFQPPLLTREAASA